MAKKNTSLDKDVSAALELLIEVVQDAYDNICQIGSESFLKHELEKSKAIIGFAEKLKGFQGRLEDVQSDWADILSEYAKLTKKSRAASVEQGLLLPLFGGAGNARPEETRKKSKPKKKESEEEILTRQILSELSKVKKLGDLRQFGREGKYFDTHDERCGGLVKVAGQTTTDAMKAEGKSRYWYTIKAPQLAQITTYESQIIVFGLKDDLTRLLWVPMQDFEGWREYLKDEIDPETGEAKPIQVRLVFDRKGNVILNTQKGKENLDITKYLVQI